MFNVSLKITKIIIYINLNFIFYYVNIARLQTKIELKLV